MKKIAKASLLVAAVTVGLSSCLKDTGYTDLFEGKGGTPVISIFGDESGEHVLGVDFSTTFVNDTIFSINLGSPTLLTQDVSATVALNPALLQGTTYELLPTEFYKIVTEKVTVKAGQRDADFIVAFNTALIPENKTYALPVSITAADGGAVVASNLKDAVYVIKKNNKFTGKYRATGTFTHPVNGPRAINEEKTLSTIDPTTSLTNFADLGGSGWTMWLRVNADNTVTLIPKGSTNPAAVQIGVNTYDPVTKVFTLNYKYPGGGGDRVITEKITYVRR